MCELVPAFVICQSAHSFHTHTVGMTSRHNTRVITSKISRGNGEWLLLRVDGVEGGVHEVRQCVHVALTTASSRVFAEAAFEGEADEHVFDVVQRERVRRIANARTLLDVCVVSANKMK